MRSHAPSSISNILLLALLAWLFSTTAHAGKSYSYYPSGSPLAMTSVPPPDPKTQSIVLMGGGYDVAEAFRWLIKRSGVQPASCNTSTCTPSTGGRFLILRATGTDAYNPYVLSRLGTQDATGPYENVGGIDLGLSSVETLIVPSVTAANDKFVVDRIKAAHAIWIAGGNQADYVKFWKGTPLNAALNEAMQLGKPIGGTSAGTAILGQYAFAALNGTVTSYQALSNPYNKNMTFDPTLSGSSPSLLNVAPLSNTITDMHLDSRDRMGRMVAFLARITNPVCNGPAPIASARAIGLDEETALLVSYAVNSNPATTAQLVSNPVYSKNANLPNPNSVYMLKFTPSSALTKTCLPGLPLTITTSALGGVFTLVRASANSLEATTTAYSSTPQPLAYYADTNVSYIVAKISFNLSDGTALCANSGTSACSTSTNMYPANGYLSGTSY